MSKRELETYHFHKIHPQIFIGTASERYAGWIGQVYSQGRYKGRIAKRTKVIGDRSFTDEVLPVIAWKSISNTSRLWKY